MWSPNLQLKGKGNLHVTVVLVSATADGEAIQGCKRTQYVIPNCSATN
jgi:hypothetical protein